MKVLKTAESDNRGVILSSDLVEICSNLAQEIKVKEKDKDGKEVEKKILKRASASSAGGQFRQGSRRIPRTGTMSATSMPIRSP